MDDNITLHDLLSRIDILEKSLKTVCENFIDCLIYDTDETDETYCSCGCRNPPLANILFRVKKADIIRVYGLRIYPTRTCKTTIINCENRGQIIKYEIYEATTTWLNEIPREQERQEARVRLIRKELIGRTLALPDE